jgi:hypothetical protein
MEAVDDKLNSFNQCTRVKGTLSTGNAHAPLSFDGTADGAPHLLGKADFWFSGFPLGVPSRPLGTIGILGLRVGEPLTVTPIFPFSNEKNKIKKSQSKGMLVVCYPAAAAQTEMRFLLEKAVRLMTRLQIPKITPHPLSLAYV